MVQKNQVFNSNQKFEEQALILKTITCEYKIKSEIIILLSVKSDNGQMSF